MHESTMEKLAKVYSETTIGNNLSVLLNYSARFFKERDDENLKMLYTLSLDIAEGMQWLVTKLQDFITTEGNECFEKAMDTIINVRFV